MLKYTSLVFCLIVPALLACKGQAQKQESNDVPVDTSRSTAVSEQKTSAGNTDSALDMLADYDKDLWDGPTAWNDEQWRWKRLLKWDKHCDYVGEVDVLESSADYQVVRVICVPGSYQPMQYLFLYDPKTKESQQLLLGEFGEANKEVLGHVSVDGSQNHLHILHLSRGTGDCGTLRKFQLNEKMTSTPTLVEKRQQACSETPLAEKQLLKRRNTSSWPLVK